MTTNIQLIEAAKRLNLKDFKGVFMRDELKSMKPNRFECGIVNLDSSSNEGTHWVCWFKNKNNKIYFDSFGIQPPLEIVEYLKSPILYNTYQIQQFNDSNCGEWCLHVLNELNKRGRISTEVDENFIDIILEIINNDK